MRPSSAVFVLLCSVCVAALAQQPAAIPGEIRTRIEKQVRQYTEAPPDAQIILGVPKTSDFTAYYALPVTIRGSQGDRTYDFLLARDFSRLIYPKTLDLTQDPFAKAEASIDLSGRPIRGNPQAAVTIVMYDDLQCPFCAKQYIALFNEVMNRYRDRVKVVLKDFPLTEAHPWAMDAAIVADCLIGQGDAQQSDAAYWQFTDYVHTHQQAVTSEWTSSHVGTLARIAEQHGANVDQAKLQACVNSAAPKPAIEKSLAEEHSLGVTATPATFINGEFFEGMLTPEQIRAAIDLSIQEARPQSRE